MFAKVNTKEPISAMCIHGDMLAIITEEQGKNNLCWFASFLNRFLKRPCFVFTRQLPSSYSGF